MALIFFGVSFGYYGHLMDIGVVRGKFSYLISVCRHLISKLTPYIWRVIGVDSAVRKEGVDPEFSYEWYDYR